MFTQIIKELKKHAPFTFLGAATGIIIIVIFNEMSFEFSNNIFYLLHPLHVVLSAIATASMYEFYQCKNKSEKCNIWVLLMIGYLGSIGIATLSDSVIPYIAEALLNMPNRGIHIGFIEKWWLINPLAFIGIAIAYFRPSTKSSHAGHVLLSTWSSLFHIMMAKGQSFNLYEYITIFAFLFIAVWIPCCTSDIVMPLLFVKDK